MRTYVLRRLLAVVPLLIGTSALTFFLLHLVPGDFTNWSLENPQVSQQTLEHMRHSFGLDQPVWVQYLLYLKNIVLHFDFGRSFRYGDPVATLLLARLGNTLLLAGAAACVTWGLAIPLGVLAASRPHSWLDRTLSLLAFGALSVPEVLSGLLLVCFAARTHWFPIDQMSSASGSSGGALGHALDVAHHLVLPAIVVGLVPLAGRMRQMRAHLLDVLHLDYVTTARAKGLPERTVLLRHALRNALNPMITLFGFTLGSLVSGSFVAEFIFDWPGLGSLTLEALNQQDQFLVMGSVLMATTVLVLGNLAADLLLAVADPRISHG